MKRFFACASFALAALFAPYAAAAVTFEQYDPMSSSEMINDSCKDLSIDSGMLSGMCNKMNADGMVDGMASTTIDITKHVACHNTTVEPFWVANASDDNHVMLMASQIKGVEVLEWGYFLSADCGGGEMVLGLGRRIRNKMPEGMFEHADSNLM